LRHEGLFNLLSFFKTCFEFITNWKKIRKKTKKKHGGNGSFRKPS